MRMLALMACLAAPVAAQDVGALEALVLDAAETGATADRSVANLAAFLAQPRTALTVQSDLGGVAEAYSVSTPDPPGAGFTHISCTIHTFNLQAADPATWGYECLASFDGSHALFARMVDGLGDGRRVERWPNGASTVTLWPPGAPPSRGFIRGSVSLEGSGMQVWLVAAGERPAP